jgi:ribonuclease BN (tRNA processing enzyme)
MTTRLPLRSALVVVAFAALISAGGGQSQIQSTKVVILGTGTPLADPDRSGPGVAIVVGPEAYIVDAGPGIVRRAAAAAAKGFPALNAQNLKRVFITHLHSDHTLGLPDLMFSPWVLGRQVPLEVYGPMGIQRMTSHLEEAWIEDEHMRMFGLEGKSNRGYRALTHEIEAGRIYDDGNVRVDAIPVAHLTWPSAFGFRFQTPDRTIVVSGDTRPTQALVDACNKCDVLVHEVYSRAYFTGPPGQPRSPASQAYHSSAHTSTTQLAELAKKAQPGVLILYHQLYGTTAGTDVEREVHEAGYSGPVVSAKDLDVF